MKAHNRKFIPTLVLCLWVLGQSPLGAQETDILPPSKESEVSQASPLLIALGTLLTICGSVLWITSDNTDSETVGISLLGGGALSLTLGLIIGGGDDRLVYNVPAALEGESTGQTGSPPEGGTEQ